MKPTQVSGILRTIKSGSSEMMGQKTARRALATTWNELEPAHGGKHAIALILQSLLVHEVHRQFRNRNEKEKKKSCTFSLINGGRQRVGIAFG